MPELPFIQDPTLLALDGVLEAEAAAEPPRDYLGASSIGEPCERKLWYRLHRPKEIFDAATLRRFIDGHRTEDLVVSWLKKVPGIELWVKDDDGKQFGFVDGRFRGNYDGIIRGIYQAPKTTHLFECKAVNQKKFDKLNKLKHELGEKQALAAWDEVYYAQAVMYMHQEKLTRHYLVCATPGGRDLISVRTNENPEYAEQLIRKAHKILNAETAPRRMTENPEFYMCRWCNFRKECHNLND